MTTSAPFLCARSMKARGSRTIPSVEGYCSSAPKTGVAEVEQRRIARDDLEAERVRARAHDVDRLRVAVGGDEEVLARVVLAHVQAQRHGLGRGRALVEHRGVGDLAGP